jgi:hypothetical protein
MIPAGMMLLIRKSGNSEARRLPMRPRFREPPD